MLSPSGGALSSCSEDDDPAGGGGSCAGGVRRGMQGAVPWRAFMRSRALQALAYTHFCNNW
jgi:hypothetical protein